MNKTVKNGMKVFSTFLRTLFDQYSGLQSSSLTRI